MFCSLILGDLELPSRINQVRFLDQVTVSRHDLGNRAAVLSGNNPKSVALLYGAGHIGNSGAART